MSDKNSDVFKNPLLRSARAKNQTVMLTPEVAAKIRAATSSPDPDLQNAVKTEEPLIRVDTNKMSNANYPSNQTDNSSEHPGIIAGEHIGSFDQNHRQEHSNSFVKFGMRYQEDPQSPRSPGEILYEQTRYNAPSFSNLSEYQHAPVSDNRSNFNGKFDNDIEAQRNMAKYTEYHQNVTDVQQSDTRIVLNGPITRLAGFLISFDLDPNGIACELRQGRWILSCRPSQDNKSIVVNDPSISPLHAIIRVTDNFKIQILDQLSEHGTAVLRSGEDEDQEVEIVGTMVNVEHGDRIRFGKRYFYVITLPPI